MALFDDTREDWNARPPTSALTRVSVADRDGLTWHWAGPPTRLQGRPHTACLAMVRAWQRFHQTDPSRRWKDIGYNGLICPHARAIEGRGVAFSASHSPSWNTSRIGVQYMVGTGEKVTPEMFARGRKLHADLERHCGHKLTDNRHRDDPKVSTECPGPQVAAWVTAGGPTTTTPQEDEMSWDEMIPRPNGQTSVSARNALSAAMMDSYRAKVAARELERTVATVAAQVAAQGAMLSELTTRATGDPATAETIRAAVESATAAMLERMAEAASPAEDEEVPA